MYLIERQHAWLMRPRSPNAPGVSILWGDLGARVETEARCGLWRFDGAKDGATDKDVVPHKERLFALSRCAMFAIIL